MSNEHERALERQRAEARERVRLAQEREARQKEEVAWCYGARHRGQSSDLWSRDKGPIPLLETILWPVSLRRGAAARVFRRVGLHERSASRRTRYFFSTKSPSQAILSPETPVLCPWCRVP